MVPDQQILGVFEDDLWLVGEPVTFFAIEPGEVTFSIGDPANGLGVTEAVTVVAFGGI
ncbi:MAG: hypothetical protein ABMB14_38160 [Myxococcota bacterium]